MFLEEKNYGIVDMVKIPFRASSLYTILMAIQKIAAGLIATVQIIITAKFLDTAISIVTNKGSIKEIFMPLFLMMACIAYSFLSNEIFQSINVKLQIKLREKFRSDIVEKAAKLKYKHIENKDTWDLISRVSKNPEVNISMAYELLLNIISMIIRVSTLLILVASKVWWTAIVILLISVPLLYISMKGGRETYEADRIVSQYKRKYVYLGEVLRGREYVSERDVFSYSDEINKKWRNEYEKARKIQFKTELKWFTRMKAGGVATAIISIAIIGIFIVPLKNGLMSIGLFMAIAQGIFELSQFMSWELSYNVDNLVKKIEYLKDLSKFVKLDETLGALDKPSEFIMELESLEFKNVSFKYPGTENYILKDMSFKIEKGVHYAFVGINGAGKTTITKLITGLYDEYDGEIILNGLNIKLYSQSDLKALTSVVYQDFSKYFVNVRDNIALGNINDSFEDKENRNILKAIETIELKEFLEELPKGIESNLGKIKPDGIDISGGQWQRIAMARAIVSDSPLRILDEPTAALDPISESNIYEKFHEISRGGTTIFISHRLGSTKLANEIFVIGDGKILEKGSHKNLMEQKGIYADMYESQRKWYL